MSSSSAFDSIKTALSLVPSSERSQLIRISILQVLLSFLDLAGVVLIGALGSLAVRGVSQQGAGDRVAQILEFLRLDEYSFQGQVTALGVLAATLLISRSIFSFAISRKTIFLMTKKSAKLSSRMAQAQAQGRPGGQAISRAAVDQKAGKENPPGLPPLR
jgi:hypothetical protein